MRQGLAVSGLLLLVGLPTVFLSEGGWTGVERHWIAPAVNFANQQIIRLRFGEPQTPGEPRVAAAAPLGRDVAAAAGATARLLANGGGNVLLAQRPTIDPFLVHARPAEASGAAKDATLAAGIKTTARAADRFGTTVANAVTETDYGAAYRWYMLAADPDNAEVRYAIALDYLDRPVEADYANAVHWLISAAELGHPRAQLDLGNMYIEGVGVTRNYAVAYKWLALAREGLTNGDQLVLAADRLARLTRAMTPDELADAAIMIESWAPKSFAQKATTDRPGVVPPTVVSG
jgi:TPR repeat protein